MNLGLTVRASVMLLALPLAGCGGSDEESAGTGGGPTIDQLTGCGINSGFKGDDVCLKPPTAYTADGIQLHYGPSDYTPAGMEPFYIEPGEEFVSCFYTQTTNETDKFFNGYHARLRPGSHHLRIFVIQSATPKPEGIGSCSLGDSYGARFLFGATSPSIDAPKPGEEFGTDVQGVAIRLPARSQIVMEVHFYNTGTERLLQEAWANFDFTDTYDILGDAVSFIGGLNTATPPGGTQIVGGTTTAPMNPVAAPGLPPGATRPMILVGHYHYHTTRFSLWHTPVGGAETLIQESFDWSEPATFRYDTKHQNPLPDRAQRIDGATSGPLVINQGDSLRWECEIHNTTDQASDPAGAPTTLTFANEVYTGEMCNVFGMYIPSMGGTWNAYQL